MTPEWIIGTLVTLMLAGVPGIYALWRDRNVAYREALEKAEERAYTRARLESVAREAQSALDAKNRELEVVKTECDDMRVRLERCLASQGGGA